MEEVDGCLRLPDDFGVSDPGQHPSRWDRSEPDVDFFLRVNPNYRRGSDLVCLCPLGVVEMAGGIARSVARTVARPSGRRAPTALQPGLGANG